MSHRMARRSACEARQYKARAALTWPTPSASNQSPRDKERFDERTSPILTSL